MSPDVTRQLQKYIDEHGGKPVHLVDASGNESIVVMRATDFEKIQRLLNDDQLELEWTAELEDRRHALIDKKYAKTLSDDERMELAILQRQAERRSDQIAAPDIAGANAIYQDLQDRLGQ